MDPFERAVSFIQSMPENGSFEVSRQDKLEFYGLFKQATVGPCNTKQPSTFDLQARYKWQAWKKLGTQSKEKAKELYVSKILNIAKKCLIPRKKRIF